MALTGIYDDDFGNTNSNAYAVVDDCVVNKEALSVMVRVKIYKDQSSREAHDKALYNKKFSFDEEEAESYFNASPTGSTRKDEIYSGAYALIKTLEGVPFEGWDDA